MLPPARSEPVYVIPGQGGDPRGALLGIYRVSDTAAAEADRILADVQRVVDAADTLRPAPSVRSLLLAPSRSAAAQQGVRQLAGYAISVILARLLTTAGMTPAAAVGQSFGEIAALVCGGALDVTDGTRAVLALNSAYRPAEGRGAMVLMNGVGEADCRRLLAESGIGDLVLACVNSPDQTVVSGPAEAVERLLCLPWPKMTRLPVPYAAHHPALAPVRDRFLTGMRELRQRPLLVPVHSPVRCRAYTDDDDLREALADCVVKPVYLTQTLSGLAMSWRRQSIGHRTFIELGTGDALTRCVQRTLPGAQTIAPLVGDPHWLYNTILRKENEDVPALRERTARRDAGMHGPR